MTKPQRSSGGSALRICGIVVAVIAILYFGRELFIPLAFAITLTVLLAPVIGQLQKWRLGRAPAVMLVMIAALTLTAGISYVIFNQVVEVLADLPVYRENIHSKVQTLKLPIKGVFGRAQQSMTELGKELETPAATGASARASQAAPLPVQVVDKPSNGLQYLQDLTQPFLAPLAIFGMVIVFTVFLLIEEADVRNRLFRLAGLDRLHVVTQALEDAVHRVSRYLFLQFLVNAIFGIVCGLGLAWIGVPYAALWGAIAAFLRIVPYVGAFAAGLPPLVLALAVFDGWKAPVLVFALYTVLELVTGNFIEPYLYGAHTGISGLALLLTTVFWTALWGPAGLILSTPLTVCVVVLGRHVPHLSFLHILLGDQPVLSPDAHLYQRLLALDDREARSIADQYLTENSLVKFYDEVIIPTLTMAEQDRHKGALEPDREEFLFLSLREMLPQLQETPTTVTPSSPSQFNRIICVAAHDEADEIAGSLLANMLEQSGCATIALPLDSSLLEMIAITDPQEDDVVIISSIPPFAFTHARTLNRRIRDRFPTAKVVIGVWGFTGNNQRAIECFRPSRPEKVVTTLAEALQFLLPNVEPASFPPTSEILPTPAGSVT